jgi:uncharacterized membrane protein
VAIAISLVPPLAVVGLLLGVGRSDDALQAGLLFLTNVAAIIGPGRWFSSPIASARPPSRRGSLSAS